MSIRCPELTAIGYVIKAIFANDSVLRVALLLAVMVALGAGTMGGMLLAGAAPIDAVRLQLVLLYVLLGAVALATLLAVLLSRRAFFTAHHQLREMPPPTAGGAS